MNKYKIVWMVLYIIATVFLLLSVVVPHIAFRIIGMIALVLAAIASFILNAKEEKNKKK